MSILLIGNPKSGRYNHGKFIKVFGILQNRFGEVSYKLTEYPGHATEISKNAKENVIIVAGGDGLINEVAQGLAGTDKGFSALAFGSVNVFCREYGIGLNPIKSAKKLSLDNFTIIPVGYVGNKIFLTMAGFGFDAQTVCKAYKYRVTKSFLFSEFIHVFSGLCVILRSKFDYFDMYFNGMTQKTYHAIISIGSCYAGNFKLGSVTYGKLNIFSLSNNGFLPVFKSMVSLFLGRGFKGKQDVADIIKIKGTSICQLDGQFTKINPNGIFIRIREDAIKLLS